MPSISKAPASAVSKNISKDDVLVVPSSGFLYVPAFFEVVSQKSSGNVRLRALGTKAISEDGDGGYVPNGTVHYESFAKKVRVSPSSDGRHFEYVKTWCGDAFVWDGEPLR